MSQPTIADEFRALLPIGGSAFEDTVRAAATERFTDRLGRVPALHHTFADGSTLSMPLEPSDATHQEIAPQRRSWLDLTAA